jgi:hypothetical protein
MDDYNLENHALLTLRNQQSQVFSASASLIEGCDFQLSSMDL